MFPVPVWVSLTTVFHMILTMVIMVTIVTMVTTVPTRTSWQIRLTTPGSW